MASEKRDSWSKFYWSDWQSDEKLGAISLGARALWLEFCALMHKASPQGHLLVNGQAVSDSRLAILCRCTPAEVRKHKKELEAAGVPEILADGTWTSRRMVRDAHRRAVNRANGEGGGNPALKETREDNRDGENSDKRTGYPIRISEPDKGSDKSHDARDPEARSQKLEDRDSAQPPSLAAVPGSIASPEDPKTLAARANAIRLQLMAVCGVDENRRPAWASYGAITGWLQAGADPDLDILPAAKAAAARLGEGGVKTPGYLTDAVLDALRNRKANIATGNTPATSTGAKPGLAQAQPMTTLAPDWQEAQHRQRMVAYTGEKRLWLSNWGPKPGEPGCDVPAKILADFKDQLEAIGWDALGIPDNLLRKVTA